MTLPSAAVFFHQRLWVFLIAGFIFNQPSWAFSQTSLSASSHSIVKNLWIDSSSDKSGFIISILSNAPVRVQTSTAPHTYRLIIDLPDTSLSPTFPKHTHKIFRAAEGDFTVIDYQSIALPQRQTKLVFTFSKPFKILSTDNHLSPHGATLLLTIAEETNAQGTPLPVQALSSLPNTSKKTSHPTKKPLIILDPGHGGEDPGAKTKSGMQEKSIVLKVAQHLKTVLEKSGTLEVALTRSSDVFIPISERVRMARDRGATLFISLHADVLPSTSSVNGLTVYTLSSVASDSESAHLAEQENISASLGKKHGEFESKDISTILMDFTTRETRMLSIAFSEKLIEHWKGDFSLNKMPLRSANFLVLKAPDVPSVLIELAYLSNEDDVKRLSSDHWQKQFCARVNRAIHSYLEEKPYLNPGE